MLQQGRNIHENHDEEYLYILKMSFSSITTKVDVNDVADDIHVIQSYHNEDIQEKIIP